MGDLGILSGGFEGARSGLDWMEGERVWLYREFARANITGGMMKRAGGGGGRRRAAVVDVLVGGAGPRTGGHAPEPALRHSTVSRPPNPT